MNLDVYRHNTNYEIEFLRKLGTFQAKNGREPLPKEEQNAKRLVLLKQYRDISMPSRQDWANLDKERIARALDEMIAELESGKRSAPAALEEVPNSPYVDPGLEVLLPQD